MSWIDDTLADYGRSLGFDNLEFNDSRSATLRFERLGDLFIEEIEGGILLYIARAYDRLETNQLVNALSATHWELNPDFPVNSALHEENTLVFSVSVPESEFNLPTLERAIDFLGRQHDSVMEM